jgi:hypothetical protein
MVIATGALSMSLTLGIMIYTIYIPGNPQWDPDPPIWRCQKHVVFISRDVKALPFITFAFSNGKSHAGRISLKAERKLYIICNFIFILENSIL